MFFFASFDSKFNLGRAPRCNLNWKKCATYISYTSPKNTSRKYTFSAHIGGFSLLFSKNLQSFNLFVMIVLYCVLGILC